MDVEQMFELIFAPRHASGLASVTAVIDLAVRARLASARKRRRHATNQRVRRAARESITGEVLR